MSMSDASCFTEKPIAGWDELVRAYDERQRCIGVNPNLREAELQKQLEEKEAAFLDLILRAYRTSQPTGFCKHGLLQTSKCPCGLVV